MSDNLVLTEKIMGAVQCLNTAEEILKCEGVFDNLEQLSGWSPHHYAKRERERAEKAEAEVERLRDLLEKVLFELEKVPFQTPKLTAFTAHRLADRYRDEMTTNSTESNKNADSREAAKLCRELAEAREIIVNLKKAIECL